MYVRFQGQRQNDVSSSKLGIFQLAFEARDFGDLPRYADEILIENIQWLKTYLPSPEILEDVGNHRAIAWFRWQAREPIKRVRAIKVILDEAGYYIDQVTERDPGVVIYRDRFQVIAKPKKPARRYSEWVAL